MQFDLQKELGLNGKQASRSFPWLYVIAGFCVVNVVVVVAILVIFLTNRNAASDPNYIPNEDIGESTKQAFDNLDVRIAQLEQAVKNISTTLKASQKDLTLIDAEQRITKKREQRKSRVLQKSGLSDKDIHAAISNLQNPSQEAAPLSAEEQADFDALIDQDDTGSQVSNFISSQTEPGKQRSYLSVMRRKGDQWYTAAVKAIQNDDPDTQIFVDNTMYFYSILSDTSTDNAIIALVQTKINQLNLQLQNAEIKATATDLSEEQKQQIAELKESLKPQETAAQAQLRQLDQRRAKGPVREYDSAGITKSYEGDWDRDPRARERQGEDGAVKKSDLNTDWDPDPRVREEKGITE